MGRSRAEAQEDGWRLVSQAGKELRALYTPFHDFLLFNFIFTLSPHSVRLAGNSVLVLPGASGCPQGRANILVCYSACRALQSPVLLSLTQEPWLEDPNTLTYHGYFHQLPDISSGASRKQGSSPCFWWTPEASPLPRPRYLFFVWRKYLTLVLFPPEIHSLTSSSSQLNELRAGEIQAREGSVSNPTLLSTSSEIRNRSF